MQTQQINLLPNLGIKQTETQTQTENGTYCHDCLNFNIDENGKIHTRQSWQTVIENANIKNLYYSKRHNELLCTIDGVLSKINIDFAVNPATKPLDEKGIEKQALSNLFTKTVTPLESVSSDKPIFYADLPLEILIAKGEELLTYNGNELKAYTKDAPLKPIVTAESNSGSLKKGTYHIGVAYLFNGQKETAMSPIAEIECEENDSIIITIPYDGQSNIENIRLYMSEPNGGILRKVSDYLPEKSQIEITVNPVLGRVAEFTNKSPMQGGKYLTVAHGRVYAAVDNRILYSENLAYHLTDLRHNYLELPERITFIIAVNGGLWIGQKTSVLFVAGTNPNEWVVRKMGTTAPIADSACLCHQGEVSAELTQNGSVAVWLGSDGYHIGTASGEHYAMQDGVLNGIQGLLAQTVAVNRRLFSLVV